MDVRFLVTGHGRSGTYWLARLLDEDKEAVVHHEPIGLDKQMYNRLRTGEVPPKSYLEVRRVLMERVWSGARHQAYAEVNSYLRYCAFEYHVEFNVPVVAIIRDGKKVIRSMMERGMYYHLGRPPIPAPGKNRFEQCCNYWQETYERLIAQGIPIFVLETMNEDFVYFEEFCKILNVSISKKTWLQYAGQRMNTSLSEGQYVLMEEEKEAYQKICGQMYEQFLPGADEDVRI